MIQQDESRRLRWRSRMPSITAGTVFLVAVLCVVSAVGLALFGGVQPVRTFVDNVLFPAPPNLAYGAFLAVLATALKRRKRLALWILIGVLALQVIGDIVVLVALEGHAETLWMDELGARYHVPIGHVWTFGTNILVSIFAFVPLWLARGEFYGRATRGSGYRAGAVFALLMAVFMSVGYGLVTLFPGSLQGVWSRVVWTAERVLGGAIDFDITSAGHAPGWVNLVLGLFGTAALFTALFQLLRAQRLAAALRPEEEQQVRQLLAEHGERDSLGYFATRRDKAVLFSDSGKAAITYRVVTGVCLASGDPLGDPEAWRPAIDKWLAMCRQYTWTPAVVGVSEPGATAYARAGMKILQLGDEAVLHVGEFGLDGRDMRPVRQAVNRVERAGHTVRIRRHREVTEPEMGAIARLAESWRDTESERGFSMALGRLGDPQDGDCVLVEALSERGEPVALLSLVPWGRAGLSLDVMRRDHDADNGVVEFMVCSLVTTAPRLGVERISLNFAMFRAAFEEGARIGAGPVLRAWRGLLLFLSRWWQLESLYRSNVKYRPHWFPRYVAFAERRDLGRLGVASAIAEGFLPAPKRRSTPDQSVAIPQVVAEVPSSVASEQQQVRQDKLAALRASDVDPYPAVVPRTERCRSVTESHRALSPDTRTGRRTSVAGRVVLVRDHGGVCFATLRDFSGDLQIMLTTKDSGVELQQAWRQRVDIGDQVSVTGEVVTSRRGEVSVLASDWQLAAKCLQPLPDKHRGLVDPESRVRQRHVDLIMRPDARESLRARGAAVHALRDALVRRDFLEVETPVLQPVHGGANARPFITHSNAYDMRLYLRIAPELYLKRLCVGGVERLFEIGRNFRNEGVSHKHNPEFTMLEAYQAFGDYATMRELCRDVVLAAATAARGVPTAVGPHGEYDLDRDWPVVPVNEAVSRALGEEITADTELPRLRKLCDAASVPYQQGWGRGALLLEMYEKLVESRTSEPTFYTDFPAEVSPLTRPHRADPRLAERWDLVAFGAELGTGYSELVDPIEQRRRLTEQSLHAAGGDPEAMELDEDFLAALEYAMPPTGGLGLGVDRLLMLITGGSIRDTLAFPLVRVDTAGRR
ncbi:bifunctional lysylphosphatidylglycerol synthetase/lysine--tRNA ligase LysX [Saccharopolyspora mangrovi]|uniref:Lysine--tRNA ligase n=1 Tax=Saccharopolyspora mangrovi TaxID=3082379 RepID=A0ABU6AEP6_9PSEU|nr:bifunctional lysylphosphatidylglycerol synthetase/lysine--tRNA ligase LysX [Saccharopolyspora sp. S2-29]MEB3370009.1 bifunctional lysylphosphatidylglycerol synthetase/lysine--tRNA ligase LysX [Saccharopolyspora sp. S2-29]